ncbi:hypothetical protein [Paraglaciecola sp. 20A4]|uniref:hypothetical protein n=1 Tax=Paraglaciecola sp. 20A4 TaxID=2687288 RepID=UPI00197FCEB7|nr:hypothetical protein [Paraglaciecola sp. 20A4]
MQLLQDYYNNVLDYPLWQAYLRQYQPATFIAAGALAYLRDVPNAELNLLDAGHFDV